MGRNVWSLWSTRRRNAEFFLSFYWDHFESFSLATNTIWNINQSVPGIHSAPEKLTNINFPNVNIETWVRNETQLQYKSRRYMRIIRSEENGLLLMTTQTDHNCYYVGFYRTNTANDWMQTSGPTSLWSAVRRLMLSFNNLKCSSHGGAAVQTNVLSSY